MPEYIARPIFEPPGAFTAPSSQDLKTARILAAIRERCRENAEMARNDPDRRRLTVSRTLRTAAQAAEQRRMLR